MKLSRSSLVLFPFLFTAVFSAEDQSAKFPCQFRTYNAEGNNPYHPQWGTPYQPLDRYTSAEYGDGKNSPSGANSPGAREISNIVNAQPQPIPSHRGVSDFFWAWGQFIDHNVDLTEPVQPPEPFNIPVPCGDPFFDPDSTCSQIIPFNRSVYTYKKCVRQQINQITSFIDGSMVYGSDSVRALAVRALDGSGRLKTSEGDLLPFNTEGLPNQPDNSSAFFLAGDIRANENLPLTCVQTLFVREHNTWCDLIGMVIPDLRDDMIYNLARAMVTAEIQSITYNEYMPLLLGPDGLDSYCGYNSQMMPSVYNEFSTACYRFGHSMVSNEILRLDSTGAVIPQGNLPVRNVFFNPSELELNGGIEPILFGLARQTAQEMDIYVVNGLGNFLFGQPQEGGFDLAALNIQRGRDHGLGNYNLARTEMGLPQLTSFSEISSNDSVVNRLQAAYSSFDDIDLWVGGLAEDNYPGSVVGPTFRFMLKKQFQRLRDCDRFWYKSYLPSSLSCLIEQRSLSEIVIQNSNVNYYKFPKNIFIADTIDYVTSVFPDLKIELKEKCLKIVQAVAQEILKLYTATNMPVVKHSSVRAKVAMVHNGVTFSNPVQQLVSMQIFSIDGKKIATLIPRAKLSAGDYQIVLPKKANGLVVIRAEGENFRLSKVVSLTR